MPPGAHPPMAIVPHQRRGDGKELLHKSRVKRRRFLFLFFIFLKIFWEKSQLGGSRSLTPALAVDGRWCPVGLRLGLIFDRRLDRAARQ
jgi:hypothetical protein